jgi:hypothetical protein
MKEYDKAYGVEFPKTTGSNLPHNFFFKNYEEIEAALEIFAIILQKELGFVNELKIGKRTEIGPEVIYLGSENTKFYGFEKEYKVCEDLVAWFKKKNNIQHYNDSRFSFFHILIQNTELELNFAVENLHFVTIPLGSVEPVFNNLLILEKLKPVLCFSNEGDGASCYFQYIKNECSLKETTDIVKNKFVSLPCFGSLYCKKGMKTQLIAELMEELEKEIETNAI